MSAHVYRDSDRVTLYGVEHLVDGTPTTLTVFLKTLDGLYVAADISLLTPVAPPEPPKPAYFEGKIEAGMRFCGEYSAKALYVGDLLPCSLRETSHVFKVERATEAGWETVWPVPEKLAPQIGGEFVLQRGQRAFYGSYSGNVDTIIIDHLAGKDVYSEDFYRIESADGVVLWKRRDSETGA